MRCLVPVVACAGACTPIAVTPPSRTLVLESPGAPAVGHSDVQLDAAAIGQLFGPELVGGNARLRHTVERGVSLEADTGLLHVSNSGDGGDRNAYTGRLGVLLHSSDGHAAIGAGLGGGMSGTAGNWGTADLHGVVSGAHRYVRPMLGAGIGYSAPFGDRTFMVRDSGGDQTTLRLPHNSIAQVELGIELGRPEAALVLGASVLHFWSREDSRVDGFDHAPQRESFVAAGIGLRFVVN